MIGAKVIEVLEQKADVIVNGDKHLRLIQLDYKANYPKGTSEEEIKKMLDQKVKEVYIIKGLYKDITRIKI